MIAPNAVNAVPTRAAQYVRMSTDQQRYSVDSQKIFIAEYAATRGYEIVDTYVDAGKSGLSLKGRAALRKLLADALRPSRSFEAILIYDVSRWGRFRDPDEAAHYEFLCRQAGVAVVYCAEPFENDFSPTAGILKNLKRVMAYEYSRELSEKLTRAHLQQARLGYKQGGVLLCGFARQLVDAHDKPKLLLRPGQQKAIKTDRIRFVLGPPAEQAVVRAIFDLYVTASQSLGRIARHLHANGIPTTDGRAWNHRKIRRILANELCVGRYVYNRTSARLQARPRENPQDVWIRASLDIPVLVSEELFAKAQARLAERGPTKKLDPKKLLDDLRALLRTKGRLSCSIIDQAAGLASATTYKQHFGGLTEAVRRIGYVKPFCLNRDGGIWTREQTVAALRRLHDAQGFLSCESIEKAKDVPSYTTVRKKLGTMSHVYALIGAPPKTSGEIIKEAMARRADKMRGSPALCRPRRKHFSQRYIVRRLKALLSKRGYLSASLIKADPTLPSITTIIERFGSVVQAYVAAGWNIDRQRLATLRNERRYAARRRRTDVGY
jgi:DNA invertase Pin-like site-specific DNA recombinase